MMKSTPTKFYSMTVRCGDFKSTYVWHPQEVDGMRFFHKVDGRVWSSDHAMLKSEALKKAFDDGLKPNGAHVQFNPGRILPPKGTVPTLKEDN